MSFHTNKKDRSKFQQHPKVKIYYLRNDQQNLGENNKIQKNKSKPTTVSCLSSLIQYDRNSFLLDQVNKNQNFEEEIAQEHQIDHQQINNQTLQKTFNKISRKISQTQANQKFNRSAFTTEINTKNHNKTNIQHLTVELPNANHRKRFIKTSQQEIFPIRKQNNQALSKDFLCNIVKEWNHFTERQIDQTKKSKTKRWKMSIQSKKHKTYRPQQVEQLRKNKTLMKEHFNLFIQDQKVKRQNKKQKSLILLKAVFNRDPSHHSVSNRHMQSEKSWRTSQAKGHMNDSLPNEMHGLNKKHQDQNMNGRRLSLSGKDEKNQYLRLIYGPQVKLIPRLFQQRSKIRNFDWTRLDREVFDSRKKIRD